MDVVKILWAAGEGFNETLEAIIADLESTGKQKAKVDHCYAKRDLYRQLDEAYDFVFLYQLLEKDSPVYQNELEELTDRHTETNFVFIFIDDLCDNEFRRSLIGFGEAIFSYLTRAEDFTPNLAVTLLNNPNSRLEAKNYLNVSTTAIAEPDKILGTVKIAVAGTERGVGCTHASITIASYLASKMGAIRNNYKVAVVDCSGTRQIACMGENLPQAQLKNSFRLNNIDFYYNCRVSDIEGLNLYSYIIIDLGVFEMIKDKGEFVRANVKLAVCQMVPWKFHQVEAFTRMISSNSEFKAIFDKIHYLFTLADQTCIRQIKNQKNVFYNTYMQDPFYINSETEANYDKLLKSVVTKDMIMPKRKGFLKQLRGGG